MEIDSSQFCVCPSNIVRNIVCGLRRLWCGGYIAVAITVVSARIIWIEIQRGKELRKDANKFREDILSVFLENVTMYKEIYQLKSPKEEKWNKNGRNVDRLIGEMMKEDRTDKADCYVDKSQCPSVSCSESSNFSSDQNNFSAHHDYSSSSPPNSYFLSKRRSVKQVERRKSPFSFSSYRLEKLGNCLNVSLRRSINDEATGKMSNECCKDRLIGPKTKKSAKAVSWKDIHDDCLSCNIENGEGITPETSSCRDCAIGVDKFSGFGDTESDSFIHSKERSIKSEDMRSNHEESVRYCCDTSSDQSFSRQSSNEIAKLDLSKKSLRSGQRPPTSDRSVPNMYNVSSSVHSATFEKVL